VADITERQQAEAALRESERRQREQAEELAVLFEAVPMPVFIARDPECLHLTGNRLADEILRISHGNELSMTGPAETRPHHFKAVKDGRELRLDELPAQRSARGEYVKDFEFDLVFDDGLVRHVLGYGTPLRDAQGRPRGTVASLVDITERKRAEDALRLTQASIDGAAEMVAWFTPGGTVHYVNDATCRTLGYSRAELLQMSALDFSPGFTWEQYQAHWQEVRARKSFTLETTHRRKDGSEYPAEVTVNHVVYGGQEYLFAYGRDITERKRAEAALRESEERYRRLMKSIPIPLGVVGPSDRLVYLNDRFTEVFGYTQADVPTLEAWWERAYPDPAQRQKVAENWRGKVARSAETGVEAAPEDLAVTCKDGSTRVVAITNLSMEDGIVAAFVDITDRKAAEVTLRTTLERFYTVLSSMYSGVLLVTNEGRVEFANQAFCDRFGLTDAPAALLGLGAADMIAKIQTGYLHPEEAVARIREILQRGQPVKGEEVAMANGGACLRDFVPLEIHAKSLGRLWLHMDITEQKRAEEELRQINEELTRFNRAAVGRELRMIELKQEVNRLCAQAGQAPPYAIDAQEEQP
jgi:PAS domain S-box-containing protein